MISLIGVEKYYGETKVLAGINLRIEKGDFISIMGSSGSGKSTLLNLIGGMDRPNEGKILVNGEDISSYEDDRLTLYRRKKIGFIFQFFNLLPNITVSENIEIPLLLNGITDNAKIKEYIRIVGLEGRERAYPYELSGGQQQRVAIARALIHDPDIILADEPTGSLDSQTGNTIIELIATLIEKAKKTVLLVTHDQSIAQLAHKTFKIKDGVILSCSFPPF
jgi:putative ABC transport system ATP-binding protein